MIQSYYGNGKGKTSAAVGAAIRCAGSGQRVLFIQFLKNDTSSEINVLKTIENIDLIKCNIHYELFDNFDESTAPAFCDAYTGLLFEKTAEKVKAYDMIVLDEVLDAVAFKYINEKDFADLLKEWKKSAEIILTGHTLPERISGISDYISEIKCINHPYDSGVAARRGIEF